MVEEALIIVQTKFPNNKLRDIRRAWEKWLRFRFLWFFWLQLVAWWWLQPAPFTISWEEASGGPFPQTRPSLRNGLNQGSLASRTTYVSALCIFFILIAVCFLLPAAHFDFENDFESERLSIITSLARILNARAQIILITFCFLPAHFLFRKSLAYFEIMSQKMVIFFSLLKESIYNLF